MSRWLSNKGCVQCRLLAAEVVLQTTWGKLSLPPPAQATSAAMQTDGKESLCIAVRTVGFAKKSIFRIRNWNKKLVIHSFRM